MSTEQPDAPAEPERPEPRDAPFPAAYDFDALAGVADLVADIAYDEVLGHDRGDFRGQFEESLVALIDARIQLAIKAAGQPK